MHNSLEKYKITCSWRCMFVVFACFTCFVHLSIVELVHLHVLPLFMPSLTFTCFLVYLYLQSLLTRRHQIQNLLIYHDTWSFRCRRPREVAGLWCGMMAPGNYWWKLCKSHWEMETDTLSQQWLSARYGLAGRKTCTNFGRYSSGANFGRYSSGCTWER